MSFRRGKATTAYSKTKTTDTQVYQTMDMETSASDQEREQTKLKKQTEEFNQVVADTQTKALALQEKKNHDSAVNYAIKTCRTGQSVEESIILNFELEFPEASEIFFSGVETDISSGAQKTRDLYNGELKKFSSTQSSSLDKYKFLHTSEDYLSQAFRDANIKYSYAELDKRHAIVIILSNMYDILKHAKLHEKNLISRTSLQSMKKAIVIVKEHVSTRVDEVAEADTEPMFPQSSSSIKASSSNDFHKLFQESFSDLKDVIKDSIVSGVKDSITSGMSELKKRDKDTSADTDTPQGTNLSHDMNASSQSSEGKLLYLFLLIDQTFINLNVI